MTTDELWKRYQRIETCWGPHSERARKARREYEAELDRVLAEHEREQEAFTRAVED